MNKKAQMGDLGMILVMFITILVGVILFQVVAQQAGETTNLATLTNVTYAAGASGTDITITTSRALSNVLIINSTGGEVVTASNYTINNNQVVEGSLAVVINVLDGFFESGNWDISATSQPLTYIPNSGGRALASLIAVFFALAVLVVAISPTLRSGILDIAK